MRWFARREALKQGRSSRGSSFNRYNNIVEKKKPEVSADMRSFLIDLLNTPYPKDEAPTLGVINPKSLVQKQFRRNQDINQKIRDALGITTKIYNGMPFYFNSDGTPYEGH
jgi:hypothetical protein